MGIEKLKQLEILKEQFGTLQLERAQAKEKVIENVVISGANDFAKFFREKEFEVKESKAPYLTPHIQVTRYEVSANFKSLYAILQYSLPAEKLMGTLFRYELSMNISKNTKCGILIDSLDRPGPVIVSRMIKDGRDETDEQMEALKDQIESYKKRPAPKQEDYGFYIREDNKMPDFSNGYKSIYELLQAIID